MKILVTAGPTREYVDPVRFLTNRSSGKMGYALARAALARGHEVLLVSGPVALQPPPGARVLGVETAAEMLKAVLDNVDWCEALIMAAAVADWRPAERSERKLKKREMQPVLKLEPTADILATVRGRKGRRIFVGFAAETGNLVAEARAKLEAKGLDLVVANDVSQPGSGFDVDTNEVVMIFADAGAKSVKLPLMTKDALADRVLAWVEEAAENTKHV